MFGAIMSTTSLCKQCGNRWNHPGNIPKRCPACKSENWDDEPIGEACGLGGGTCDQCDARFITALLQDHFCPNCGSKKWDSGKVTEIPSTPKVTEIPSREFECTKCEHHWFSRLLPGPKQCPRKPCQSRKIRGVLK